MGERKRELGVVGSDHHGQRADGAAKADRVTMRQQQAALTTVLTLASGAREGLLRVESMSAGDEFDAVLSSTGSTSRSGSRG